MKLVILGAPGAGKGTQSEFIKEHFKIAHIATGDMLRQEISSGSKLGLEVENVIKSGSLVNDDLMNKIVKERLSKDDCKNGFLLDGYPRTKAQVDALEANVGELDKAIYINVSDALLIDRLASREICVSCGAVFNKKTKASKKEGVCDDCGKNLTQRTDDNLESVKIRLEKYKEETMPLVDYFKEKNILLEVNGEGDVEKITKDILNGLGA